MFTIHDVRQTGCPELGRTTDAETAWRLVDALGIPREKALVTPRPEDVPGGTNHVVELTDEGGVAHVPLRTGDERAQRSAEALTEVLTCSR